MGNHPAGNYQGVIFLGYNYPRGQLFRGNNPRAIIQGSIILGTILFGGSYPGAIFLRGNCPDINRNMRLRHST